MLPSSTYLRVSLTDRCNLRCVYCLPEHAAFAASRASSSELRALTSLIVAAAHVDKIRLTGGEPTLCHDLVDHVRHARSLVDIVGMTSNGILLEPLLEPLRDAGLNRINISLDALTADGFRKTSRRDGLDRVVAAIRTAKRLGFDPVKVNAVAMEGTDVAALVRFAAWEGVHIRFIELMAIGEARAFHATAFLPARAMREIIAAAGITLREAVDRDEPTSRVWTIQGVEAREASVGFITTNSAPFCATCNRLRLSSQGVLYSCLMAATGADLISRLRAGDEHGVLSAVRQTVTEKAPPPRFERVENMASIGG